MIAQSNEDTSVAALASWHGIQIIGMAKAPATELEIGNFLHLLAGIALRVAIAEEGAAA